MKTDELITEVFEQYDTNVLNIADYDITSGIDQVTHVVLDGDRVIPYMANPDLMEDFQDDDYEQLLIEDEGCLSEIRSAILDML